MTYMHLLNSLLNLPIDRLDDPATFYTLDGEFHEAHLLAEIHYPATDKNGNPIEKGRLYLVEAPLKQRTTDDLRLQGEGSGTASPR